MRPVLTVAEMQAADAAALEHTDEATLVSRAGRAVALGALELLGGAYGRRVTVVVGKGNNGNDGRVAAHVLRRRGARVTVVEAASAPETLGPCDLVIDAALGTGARGAYVAPRPPEGVPVLAVDIPSGVDGDTGAAEGRPVAARRTVTMVALKVGLLQDVGAELSGLVGVADIGIAVGPPGVGLMEDADAALVPGRGRSAYKWQSAVAVVGGSPGMEGAAALSARGAVRAGAGMVRLAVPGAAGQQGTPGPWPIEAVRHHLGEEGWADDVLGLLERCRALVVGPGLGRAEATGAEIRRLIARSPVPVVADADALFALGDAGAARAVVEGEGGHRRPVVLTPHDGEYRSLMGAAPGPDRVDAARRLAARSGAVALLKGPLTAVAEPTGGWADQPGVLLAAAGSPRLATAGTGDVLSGVIGAFLAAGLDAPVAAALAAHVHGRAAGRGRAVGLGAGDLPDLVADWLSDAAAPQGPAGGSPALPAAGLIR